ncbi:MAG: FKBP-type peptidyl-prolyl cis-trans isomerase [Bacteroidales bacterium]|nr:FKBP-type peptidyl-prolyl cis-trans isomerase [Bacteroidales bacterium]
MKRLITLFAAAAISASAFALSQEPDSVAFVPTPQTIKDVSYLLGVNFGSFIKNYDFGDDLDFQEILSGMAAFIRAKGDYDDPDFVKQFRVDPNTMNDLFNNYLDYRRQEKINKNKKIEEEFLAENALKPGVTVSPSGLQYVIITGGNDVIPALEDTVCVRYSGKLLDGTVIDETKEDPLELVLDRTISGWQEGLSLIGEGGVIILYIPANLAYGDAGAGNGLIPPGSTLIFTVTLEKVKKFDGSEWWYDDEDDEYYDYY